MQAIANVNTILQNISSLSLEDQFYIAEILDKRIHELKREKIFQRAKEAEENYKANRVTVGNAHDLLKMIKND
ncbi:MAG: hypothetical protein H8D45_15190 [Bacteroidetes bacterium]|nr:hypothetical protein [Bacteroidota bacterium]MBL7103534.1 hypothetical protein [Bacteroidales bacterium]